jgi:tRNA 2-selenouridine synthase
MSGIGIPTSYSLKTFRSLKGPLIDIRSPKEYKQGHWPGSHNIPLFDDEERALIGSTYKSKGRESAVIAGLRVTSPKLEKIKNQLELQQSRSTKSHLRIYCWRGGMRSASVGWLANALGLNPVLLSGGYKTYRRWAINQFEKKWPLRLLAGKTGTGKTPLLVELSKKGIFTIDLEGLANHKGSSFGGLGLGAQPSCEQFENLLAQALHNSEVESSQAIWLEAESANLGKCRIPHKLFEQMKNARVLEITKSKNERIKILVDQYSRHKRSELIDATVKISKRLGPQRTKQAIESIEVGSWADACLAILEYYDKCYEHELKKIEHKETIDLSGLGNKSATEKLIANGLMY